MGTKIFFLAQTRRDIFLQLFFTANQTFYSVFFPRSKLIMFKSSALTLVKTHRIEDKIPVFFEKFLEIQGHFGKK